MLSFKGKGVFSDHHVCILVEWAYALDVVWVALHSTYVELVITLAQRSRAQRSKLRGGMVEERELSWRKCS